MASISKRAKSQMEIAEKLGERYLSELMTGWDFNPEEVAIVLKVKKDALLRVVKN